MNYPAKVLAIDLETTGTNSAYDYIEQIGCAVMENGDVSDTFSIYIQPNMEKVKFTPAAMSVKFGDVTTEAGSARFVKYLQELMSRPTSGEASKQFAEWAGKYKDLPIVAHNASFDMAFMSSLAFQQKRAVGALGLGAMTICTMQLTKKAAPGGDSYGLDGCLTAFGLPTRPDHHDALQDAILAGRLYFECVKVLEANLIGAA